FIAGSVALTRLADQLIIAGSAFQHAAAVADNGVVEVRSAESLDIRQRIGAGAARRLRPGSNETHRDAGGSVLVTRDVKTAAAVEGIGAQTALEHIIVGVAC